MKVTHTYQGGSTAERQSRLEALHRKCLLLLRQRGLA